MKHIKKAALFIIILISVQLTFAKAPKREYYTITIYHFQDKAQEEKIDAYLQKALLPALHRHGIAKIGVFKPIGNDTLSDKRVYVLTPYKNMDQYLRTPATLAADNQYLLDGKPYLNAVYNEPSYKRMESMLLHAFSKQPLLKSPTLKGDFADRVYELRSYESPTEKLHQNKVHMFNEGGETDIFDRLNFNPMFYGSVIAGSNMPNLIYLTAFENKEDRDAHWQAFKDDAAWKKLAAMDFYKKNVSRSEILFLRPAGYSDL